MSGWRALYLQENPLLASGSQGSLDPTLAPCFYLSTFPLPEVIKNISGYLWNKLGTERKTLHNLTNILFLISASCSPEIFPFCSTAWKLRSREEKGQHHIGIKDRARAEFPSSLPSTCSLYFTTSGAEYSHPLVIPVGGLEMVITTQHSCMWHPDPGTVSTHGGRCWHSFPLLSILAIPLSSYSPINFFISFEN